MKLLKVLKKASKVAIIEKKGKTNQASQTNYIFKGSFYIKVKSDIHFTNQLAVKCDILFVR